jgi:hypothetical protein
MSESRRNVLGLLKKELAFLDREGYRRSPSFPWRSRYIFEESPSCPNFADRTRPHRCTDCWLMEFVAPHLRTEQTPCRFVELAAKGLTVDSLYRCGTLAESEQALRQWLRQRIREFEADLEVTSELGTPNQLRAGYATQIEEPADKKDYGRKASATGTPASRFQDWSPNAEAGPRFPHR